MKGLFLLPVLLGNMTITSYRSVEEQTDDTPYITSTGEHVHSSGIALSRDLLKRWGGSMDYGDLVYVEGFGVKIVNDCMGDTRCTKWKNKACVERTKIRNHVDIWVRTEKEEKQVGWRQGKVWLIKFVELRKEK